MLWIFVITGLITLVSALSSLVTTLKSCPRDCVPHVAAVVLLCFAWTLQHTTATGWAALLAAFGIELLVWVPAIVSTRGSKTRMSPTSQDEPSASPLSQDEPRPSAREAHRTPGVEAAPQRKEATSLSKHETAGFARDDAADAAPVSPAPPLTTYVLLTAPWKAAPDVFVASLRRGGQRDATLVHEPTRRGSVQIQVGPIALELVAVPGCVPRSQIDYATVQSWDWLEASQAAARHTAHVAFTTRSTTDTARADVVRLHHRAHAALAEFAPVVAAMWPDAGRLVRATDLAELARRAAEVAVPVAVCINFRTFPRNESGRVVSDTVGLHAFGLPDLQIVTDGEPEETVSAILHPLAEQFFASGCSLAEEQVLSLEDYGDWRTRRTRAQFPPQREVIELMPVSKTPTPPPPKSEAT